MITFTRLLETAKTLNSGSVVGYQMEVVWRIVFVILFPLKKKIFILLVTSHVWLGTGVKSTVCCLNPLMLDFIKSNF